jgi:hypothetical protein
MSHEEHSSNEGAKPSTKLSSVPTKLTISASVSTPIAYINMVSPVRNKICTLIAMITGTSSLKRLFFKYILPPFTVTDVLLFFSADELVQVRKVQIYTHCSRDKNYTL